MIKVKNLIKSFGTVYALRGVSLHLEKGCLLSIFGPNGAGKSTFIRIVATLSQATSGQLEIDGLSVQKQAARIRQRLGVIAHSTFLYDELTAQENLQFYSKLYGLNKPGPRIEKLLNDVGLKRRRDDRVRTFSRGMQQRLSIARAMLHDPDILCLDEPYTGLDQHASQILTDWLKLLRSEKRTILLVTHNIPQGLRLADQVAIFNRGKLALHEDKAGNDADIFLKRYNEIISQGGHA